jgi:hypothetical protein
MAPRIGGRTAGPRREGRGPLVRVSVSAGSVSIRCTVRGAVLAGEPPPNPVRTGKRTTSR